MSDLLIELEDKEAKEKVNNGQLTVEYYGSENTYYTDSEEKNISARTIQCSTNNV